MKMICVCSVLLFIAVTVTGQRGNTCFNHEEVRKAIRECVNNTKATDILPTDTPTVGGGQPVTDEAVERFYEESERQGDDEAEGGNRRPGGFPGGRPDRRPNGGGRPGRNERQKCAEKVLSGVQNSSAALDFDSITRNLDQVVNPEKGAAVEGAVDKCRKLYESEEEMAKELRKRNRDYQRCFRKELREICRRSRQTTPLPEVVNPEAVTEVDNAVE